MIKITSKQDGFRRCGVAHPSGPTEYPDNSFTKEQLAILKTEPMLVVEVTEDAPSRPNAQETIALVKAAGTVEELGKLAEGEDRDSVLKAIAKRRGELTK